MLHLDEIAAKLQHHCQILKTDLDQTVSDLRFDFVGDLVCVPEAPQPTRRSPHNGIWLFLSAFQVWVAVPGVPNKKLEIAYLNLVKPYQIFDLTL